MKNRERDERLTLDTAVSTVTDNDMDDHDSIPTDPEILALFKSSRRVLAPIQPPIARVSATTFLRKGGGGWIQQLRHEAGNSPSSYDVIKIKLNFHHPPYVYGVVLHKQKKNLLSLFPSHRKAGSEDLTVTILFNFPHIGRKIYSPVSSMLPFLVTILRHKGRPFEDKVQT